jgi:hypothetical protein
VYTAATVSSSGGWDLGQDGSRPLKGDAMTFVEKHRSGGSGTEHEWLTLSWEGETFGVGMFEAMAEIQPEHADAATACATMESGEDKQQRPHRPESGRAVRRGRTRP